MTLTRSRTKVKILGRILVQQSLLRASTSRSRSSSNCWMARRLIPIVQHIAPSWNPTSGHPIVSVAGVHSGKISNQKPALHVNPQVALYDEKVQITLDGFPQNQKVTLRGQVLQGEAKIIFASCGHYLTDSDGKLDLTRESSQGGTYTGQEPMGLIWSLKPAPGQPRDTRMAINFTDRPCIINLKAYVGDFFSLEDFYGSEKEIPEAKSSLDIERWFRSPGVQRIEVEEGNVRGALFLPPGDGPFQGVIDMFGSTGGLIEYRAALLASRGFAALALPYFKYKDLPKFLEPQNFDYFEEAVSWFSCHPKVHKGGIGVVAVSKGVEYALCMSAFTDRVKAVVSINGFPFVCLGNLMYKNKVLLRGGEFIFSNCTWDEDGLDLRKAYPEPGELIPIWQSSAKHLWLVCLDDYQLDWEQYKLLLEACPEEKRKDIEVVTYPGAGHLLEPPYNALCYTSINRGMGFQMKFGGRPKEHALAQEDSWQRILSFLRQNIPTH